MWIICENPLFLPPAYAKACATAKAKATRGQRASPEKLEKLLIRSIQCACAPKLQRRCGSSVGRAKD